MTWSGRTSWAGAGRKPAYLWRWRSDPDMVEVGPETGLGQFRAAHRPAAGDSMPQRSPRANGRSSSRVPSCPPTPRSAPTFPTGTRHSDRLRRGGRLERRGRVRRARSAPGIPSTSMTNPGAGLCRAAGGHGAHGGARHSRRRQGAAEGSGAGRRPRRRHHESALSRLRAGTRWSACGGGSDRSATPAGGPGRRAGGACRRRRPAGAPSAGRVRVHRTRRRPIRRST